MVVVMMLVPRVLAAGEQPPMGIGIHQHTEGDLPNLVAALRATSGCPRRLHCRQQQAHQRADDGNHHQQFDQRESRTTWPQMLHDGSHQRAPVKNCPRLPPKL